MPSLRFLPLQRLRDRGQPPTSRGLPLLGLRCLLSVLHALEAFLHPRSPGFVSCRSRSWGSLPSGSFGVRRAIDPLGPFFPLVVLLSSILCRIGLAGWCSSLGRLHRLSVRPFLIRLRIKPLPLQGFDPYGRLILPFGLFSLLGTSTLLGFFLLRGFPLSPAGLS